MKAAAYGNGNLKIQLSPLAKKNLCS